MRTSVEVPDDDQDEFPGCAALVDSEGRLTIADQDDNVETVYEPGEWLVVVVTAGDE